MSSLHTCFAFLVGKMWGQKPLFSEAKEGLAHKEVLEFTFTLAAVSYGQRTALNPRAWKCWGSKEWVHWVRHPAQTVTAPIFLLNKLNSPFYFSKTSLCLFCKCSYFPKVQSSVITHDLRLSSSLLVQEAPVSIMPHPCSVHSTAHSHQALLSSTSATVHQFSALTTSLYLDTKVILLLLADGTR